MPSLQDYLEKNYLSAPPKEKKKSRKISKPSASSRIRIIDESENFWKPVAPSEKEVHEIIDSDEEKPVVTEFVDERPVEVVAIERFRASGNWKLIGDESSNSTRSYSRANDVKLEPNSEESGSLKVAPRRRRHDSSDASPPRAHGSSSDASPIRKRHDTSDAPPKRTRHDSSDASPPRNSRELPDSSNHRPRRHDSSDDASPPRRREDSSDASPPRARHDSSDASPPRARHYSGEESPKREDKFSKMHAADASAKGSEETIYRDRKTGKRKEPNKELEAKQKLLEERVNSWKKGVLQNANKEDAINDAIHEMGKSFTRLEGDADLEDMLKRQERLEDPMAEYLSKKKAKKSKVPEMPKYAGPWPMNRYNIPPGYRWDGVDRSNGYEKKYFERINEKKAWKEEAHKWSTEDM